MSRHTHKLRAFEYDCRCSPWQPGSERTSAFSTRLQTSSASAQDVMIIAKVHTACHAYPTTASLRGVRHHLIKYKKVQEIRDCIRRRLPSPTDFGRRGIGNTTFCDRLARIENTAVIICFDGGARLDESVRSQSLFASFCAFAVPAAVKIRCVVLQRRT
jgi:hypothetical protein